VPGDLIVKIVKDLATKPVNQIVEEVDELTYDGFSADQILKQYFLMVIEDEQVPVKSQSRILEKIADCERKIVEGTRDDLVLYDLFCGSQKILKSID
jgi:uncharacterized protein (DUF2344 family)